MLDHAVDFYKNLFGLEETFGLKLNDNFWEEEDKATDSENELLEAPFTEEEIKLVVLTPMPREPGTRWFLFYVLSNLFGR